ncbi:hypothetical protein, partial [Corynebacterium tuberculostearicum]
MVFTAVLAAIAVIAAMVTVPGVKARAASGEHVEIQANNEMGNQDEAKAGMSESWGNLVWAGKPVPKEPGFGNVGYHGNDKNNAGWAWCIDAFKWIPAQVPYLYDINQAQKLDVPDELNDAAINVATHLKQAYKNGEKQRAGLYSYYLSALIGGPYTSKEMRHLMVSPSDFENNEVGKPILDEYREAKGSVEEFTALTGYTIEKSEPWSLKPAEGVSVDVPKAPEGSYITLVGPNGKIDDPNLRGQRVFPPEQPGLPDENGGSGSNPSTMTPEISTKVDQLGEHEALKAGTVVTDHVHYEGLVPNKEYILNAELRNKTD